MRRLFIILIFFVVFMTGCDADRNEGQIIHNEKTNAKVGNIGADIPVTRAMAAKMTALAFKQKDEIELMERKISFDDCDVSMWYDKYVNCVCSLGIMSGVDELNFKAEDYLTILQAQYLIDKINPDNKIKININDENKDKPISYELWTEIFKKVSDGLGNTGIFENNAVVLGIHETNDIIPECFMITDKGIKGCEGENLSKYNDCRIKFLEKKGEIVSVISVEDITPSILNAYVTAKNDTDITIFSGGAERTFLINGQGDTLNIGDICDIRIKDSTAAEVNKYEDKKEGKVLSIGNNFIEIEGYGNLMLDTDTAFYIIKNDIVFSASNKDVIAGCNAKAVVDGNNVKAVIVSEFKIPKNIRVALSTTGYKSLVHTGVTVRGKSDFTVYTGKNEIKLKKGENFLVNKNQNADLFGSQRVIIKSDDSKSPLEITSFSRGEGIIASYIGSIEISKNEKGYYIVNELPFNDYICGVISSKDINQIKGQKGNMWAVILRNKAYFDCISNKFGYAGANCDDFSCGVYSGVAENEDARKSVNDTENMFLTFDEKIVSLNYFLQSAGTTADFEDVWPDNERKYMSHILLSDNENYLDLSDEKKAYEFFKSSDIECVEKGSQWYRWNYSITGEEIKNNIIKALSEGLIKRPYYETEGNVDGNLKSVDVIKRGKGGNITILKITMDNGYIVVEGYENIKHIFKNNKGVYAPSLFFVFDTISLTEGGVKELKLYGGGYGHGAGLSINGAYKMIDNGMDYKDVLKKFYTNVEINKLTDD